MDFRLSKEREELVLPKLVSGEAVIARAIMEPDAGSDAASASTAGIKDGDEWVINGSEMFITNGVQPDPCLYQRQQGACRALGQLSPLPFFHHHGHAVLDDHYRLLYGTGSHHDVHLPYFSAYFEGS
jgi:alkylation response protein AidB-like acyl-CoA dehydrogenase